MNEYSGQLVCLPCRSVSISMRVTLLPPSRGHLLMWATSRYWEHFYISVEIFSKFFKFSSPQMSKYLQKLNFHFKNKYSPRDTQREMREPSITSERSSTSFDVFHRKYYHYIIRLFIQIFPFVSLILSRLWASSLQSQSLDPPEERNWPVITERLRIAFAIISFQANLS